MEHDISRLQAAAVAFRDERDWKQFHRPKDLALGLLAEAGELAEVFLWKGEDELTEGALDERLRERLREEMADVFLFLLYLAEYARIDLGAACEAKLELNGRKYPVEKAKGTARKYDEL